MGVLSLLLRIAIGVPAGIGVGRSVWQLFADSLVVAPEPVVVAWVVVAVALGTIIIANLLAIGPALLAARMRPSSLLKAE